MYQNVRKSEAVRPTLGGGALLFYTSSLFPWGYSLDILLLHIFPIAHGLLAVNDHLAGIMDNSVADGVSQDRIANLFSPSSYRELRAEDWSYF